MSKKNEENRECPLCMEAFELDDINFFPCTCGYQICRFCWHRIRTNENSLCPACRKQYSEDPANFKPLTAEELQKIKNEKKLKDQQRKQKISEKRKHLGNLRVVQKNLVFVVGLPGRLAENDELRKPTYFGKFGKIVKVIINHNTSYAGSQGPSSSAYITYQKSDDALRAIQSVNNSRIDRRTLKASLGTTKYCSNFLRKLKCPKVDCMYLHDIGDEAGSFTKEEMQMGKHQEYEQRLHEQMLTNCQNRKPPSPIIQSEPTFSQKEGEEEEDDEWPQRKKEECHEVCLSESPHSECTQSTENSAIGDNEDLSQIHSPCTNVEDFPSNDVSNCVESHFAVIRETPTHSLQNKNSIPSPELNSMSHLNVWQGPALDISNTATTSQHFHSQGSHFERNTEGNSLQSLFSDRELVARQFDFQDKSFSNGAMCDSQHTNSQTSQASPALQTTMSNCVTHIPAKKSVALTGDWFDIRPREVLLQQQQQQLQQQQMQQTLSSTSVEAPNFVANQTKIGSMNSAFTRSGIFASRYPSAAFPVNDVQSNLFNTSSHSQNTISNHRQSSVLSHGQSTMLNQSHNSSIGQGQNSLIGHSQNIVLGHGQNPVMGQNSAVSHGQNSLIGHNPGHNSLIGQNTGMNQSPNVAMNRVASVLNSYNLEKLGSFNQNGVSANHASLGLNSHVKMGLMGQNQIGHQNFGQNGVSSHVQNGMIALGQLGRFRCNQNGILGPQLVNVDDLSDDDDLGFDPFQESVKGLADLIEKEVEENRTDGMPQHVAKTSFSQEEFLLRNQCRENIQRQVVPPPGFSVSNYGAISTPRPILGDAFPKKPMPVMNTYNQSASALMTQLHQDMHPQSSNPSFSNVRENSIRPQMSDWQATLASLGRRNVDTSLSSVSQRSSQFMGRVSPPTTWSTATDAESPWQTQMQSLGQTYSESTNVNTKLEKMLQQMKLEQAAKFQYPLKYNAFSAYRGGST